MKKRLPLLLVAILVGCSYSERARELGLPWSSVGVRDRYDYPFCSEAVSAFPTLGVSIRGVRLAPSPDGIGCRPASRRWAKVNDKDSYGGQKLTGWLGMDQVGGFFSEVAYRSDLLNTEKMREEEAKRQSDIRAAGEDCDRTGECTRYVVVVDELLTINGSRWRHVVEDTVSTSPPDQRQVNLRDRHEMFSYQIDATHVLRETARYGAQVTEDADWYAARRGLLRTIVESIRIEPLTQQDTEAAWAQYHQVNDEWDVMRDEHFRKRGIRSPVTDSCDEAC